VRGDFCWYWWNCWPTHWVMVNNSTNISKHHLSLQLIEW
jgi:hypothetical protein